MSEPQVRRFPFWLTLSVLANLVLLGLLAGIFLKAPKPVHPRGHVERPPIELSDEDRAEVRLLMRESFEAARPAMDIRREAERALAETLKAEPYNEDAARAALAHLRETDRTAREIVGNHLFDHLDTLSPEQREVIALMIAGNIEKRGKRHEKIKKFRENRGDAPPPPPEE